MRSSRGASDLRTVWRFVLLAVVVFFALWIAPEITVYFRDSRLQRRIIQTRDNARLLTRAIESYRTDLGAFPPRLDALTTPAIYLEVPEALRDPFGSEESTSLVYEHGPETFQIRGRGPDWDDDHGLIAYDPTNGLASNGDFVFTGPRDAGLETSRQALPPRNIPTH